MTLAAASVGATQEGAADASPASDPSQETEVTEDNYRRFMELKDARLRRQDQPYAALAPPSGLLKLDELPEASQKHLRNQLRSIIVEGERWAPAEQDKPYPFAPSAAALSDPELREQEAAAWTELVASYHAREAEIYQAARLGQGPTGADGATAQATGKSATSGQPGGPAASAAADPAMAETDGSQFAPPQGVTQNAMEYLRQSGLVRQADGSPGAGETGSASDARQGTQPGAESPAETRTSENQAPSQGRPAQAAPSEAKVSEAKVSEATASEAMSSDASTSEAQNPRANQEVIYRSKGVIAIRDLDKVEGVQAAEEEAPDEAEDPPNDDG